MEEKEIISEKELQRWQGTRGTIERILRDIAYRNKRQENENEVKQLVGVKRK